MAVLILKQVFQNAIQDIDNAKHKTILSLEHLV